MIQIPVATTTLTMGPFILVGVAVLAFLFVVLPFLQKRLKIFTRGTLAFMISALMAFTVVDGISRLNDIRNSELRLKIEAREASVASLLQSFFGSGVAAAMEQVPFHLHREDLLASLKEMNEDFEEALRDSHSPAKTLPELRLVCLDVSRALVSPTRRLNPAAHLSSGWDWGFRAILDDGEQFIEYSGYLRVDQPSGGPVTIINAHGKKSDQYQRDDSKVAYRYRDSRAYQNEDYQLSARQNHMQLVSNH